MWHVGDVVRKLRQKRGWSIVDLAMRAGIDKGTVSRLENDGTRARPGTLRRIALALGLTVHEIAELVPKGPLPKDEEECLQAWRLLTTQQRDRFKSLMSDVAATVSRRPQTGGKKVSTEKA